MKKKIRLTESQLIEFIENTVKKLKTESKVKKEAVTKTKK